MSCAGQRCQEGPLDVWVLCGGLDRERPVSLASGQHVAKALVQAGHRTILCDVNPENIGGVLDEFEKLQTATGKLIFPMIHGLWGEGGALQGILEDREIGFVTTGARGGRDCMDKYFTKKRMVEHDLPTLDFKMIEGPRDDTFPLPMVIKAVEEGSSFGMAICQTAEQAKEARERLFKGYDQLMAERYLRGAEMTVGVLEVGGELVALPPIKIIPAQESYDYRAKYVDDDTQYLFDTGLPELILDQIKADAVRLHRLMGARDLSRVDFLVDENQQHWILEINTIPGFTGHSLFPKAALAYGLPLVKLVDLLASQAYQRSRPGCDGCL